MNRREAIIAGVAGITAAVAVAPTVDAQASEGANPDLDQIRALLRAHDEAFTNHDLNGVIACFSQTPAGVIGAEPAPTGQEKQYNVRALGLLTDPKQLSKLSCAPTRTVPR